MAIEIAKRIRVPQFIGLIGPMGVGKTYFVKALVKALGINDATSVNSPSFALHQRYENRTYCVDHLDLYRVENESDLESIGFWDLFADSENIILVEWADRIDSQLIPKKYQPLFIKFEIENNFRKATKFEI
jgi:tRNA threonylcarbamoyladenosine biosynthesis protein TsaE